jgi:hypothetical protein
MNTKQKTAKMNDRKMLLSTESRNTLGINRITVILEAIRWKSST